MKIDCAFFENPIDDLKSAIEESIEPSLTVFDSIDQAIPKGQSPEDLETRKRFCQLIHSCFLLVVGVKHSKDPHPIDSWFDQVIEMDVREDLIDFKLKAT